MPALHAAPFAHPRAPTVPRPFPPPPPPPTTGCAPSRMLGYFTPVHRLSWQGCIGSETHLVWYGQRCGTGNSFIQWTGERAPAAPRARCTAGLLARALRRLVARTCSPAGTCHPCASAYAPMGPPLCAPQACTRQTSSRARHCRAATCTTPTGTTAAPGRSATRSSGAAASRQPPPSEPAAGCAGARSRREPWAKERSSCAVARKVASKLLDFKPPAPALTWRHAAFQRAPQSADARLRARHLTVRARGPAGRR